MKIIFKMYTLILENQEVGFFFIYFYNSTDFFSNLDK